MTQKFILFTDKTSKKEARFKQQKTKRFCRKQSDRSDSRDSRLSKGDSVASQYIKHGGNSKDLKISKIHDEASNFLQKFNKSIMIEPASTIIPQNRVKNYSRCSTNRDRVRDETSYSLKIQTLQAEIELKNHQLQVITAETDRYKLNLDEEKEKRRKLQNQKRNMQKVNQQLQKSLEAKSIENKKLSKQKEYLLKQVEFLEKINYDEKTRSIQSYREKYMEEELNKLREEVKIKKTGRQLELEKENQIFRHERDSYEDKVRAMKLMVSVLQNKLSKFTQVLQQERKLTHERIVNSQQYLQLREKYKRFLDQYKQIRAQNWNLKCIVDEKETELLLSDSEVEGS